MLVSGFSPSASAEREILKSNMLQILMAFWVRALNGYGWFHSFSME